MVCLEGVLIIIPVLVVVWVVDVEGKLVFATGCGIKQSRPPSRVIPEILKISIGLL